MKWMCYEGVSTSNSHIIHFHSDHFQTKPGQFAAIVGKPFFRNKKANMGSDKDRAGKGMVGNVCETMHF